MGDEFDIEGIKVKINNMLWLALPGNTTLDEAELIAMEIFEVFVNFEEKRKKQQEPVSPPPNGPRQEG